MHIMLDRPGTSVLKRYQGSESAIKNNARTADIAVHDVTISNDILPFTGATVRLCQYGLI